MKKIMSFLLIFTLVVVLTGCKNTNESNTDKFNEMNLFKEGLLGVEKDDKWGYIDKDGDVVIDFLYDGASAFYKGLAVVIINDKYQLIDKEGKSVFEETYDMLVRFEEDVLIYESNDKYGLLSIEGEIITDALYDSIEDFHDGLAVVESNDLFGFIDLNGDTIVSIQYDSVSSFSNGMAIIENDEKFGYIDAKGLVQIDFLYDDANNFQENGLAIACIDVSELCYLIDKDGETIFSAADIYGHGPLYEVHLDVEVDEYYVYTEEGNLFNSDIYSYIWYINGYYGNLEFEEEDLNIWFNEDGTIRHQALYDDSDFVMNLETDEMFFAIYDGEYIDIYDEDGFVRLTGESVSQITNNNHYVIERNDKYGIVNKDNSIVIEFLYDMIVELNDGYFAYESNDKYGILDSDYELIITATYTNFAMDINPY